MHEFPSFCGNSDHIMARKRIGSCDEGVNDRMNNGNYLKFGEFDFITIKTDSGRYMVEGPGYSVTIGDIQVCLDCDSEPESISLRADKTPVEWIRIRWNKPMPEKVKILGDAWERGYGDLEWKGFSGNRCMPWYFLMSTDKKQWGYGVKVRPSAMCYWQVDSAGITLVLDVRCGGDGVILGGRKLELARLTAMELDTEDSFQAAKTFCRIMCDDPILPDFPVYGSNNWYYAYGDSSEKQILEDADYLLEITKGADNAPYMVIDDCWQEHHRLNEYNGGPWTCGNEKFPDMKGLAEKLVKKGVRPGIWLRLLQNESRTIPPQWKLERNGCLDPTHPGALAYIKEDIKRICEWGYTLIKHDFSTYDLFGRWGFEMNPLVTENGWHFYDRSKTSAEAVKILYQAIYEAAQPYHALILGCNTIGHLGAGLMQMARSGDDTSGHHWERTRWMGVNTLAFRLPQHRTFFDMDADCVGITGDIPWDLNRRWADLVAESGTPLFVSARPGVLNQEEKEELHQIMLKASCQNSHKVPVDWQYNNCPEIWKDETGQKQYYWFEKGGARVESNDQMYHGFLPM